MILPIYTYGQGVLREKCKDITPEYPGLKDLIANMFETMYQASGIGLAAPQVGFPIRLFIVDLEQLESDKPNMLKQVFINAQILEEWDTPWKFEEGCLSIPGIKENVSRHAQIKIKYLDENFKEHVKTFDDMTARVIQHEYDHIEGVLFTDKVNPLRKKFLQKRLKEMAKGAVRADYKIKLIR
jgi:peptide deformylase